MPVSPTRKDVDACAFRSWYPHFEKETAKSISIDLPKEFLQYLKEDGIFLPKEVQGQSIIRSTGVDELDDSEEESEVLTEDSTFDVLPSFETLSTKISDAIATLGGSVFPKLNWSGPKDAIWVTGSLRCQTVEEVYLLLKSSDFILHDLDQAYSHCCDEDGALSSTTRSLQEGQNFYLVLRKWSNLKPAMEFRCFVKGGALIGICQRNCSNYYAFLEDMEEEIAESIAIFFRDKLKRSSVLPHSYAFDVYVDRTKKVWLWDINVYSETTDALMFSWEELDGMDGGSRSADEEPENEDFCGEEFQAEIRIVRDQNTILPNPLSSYRVPVDMFEELALQGGMQAFIEKCRNESKNESSEED